MDEQKIPRSDLTLIAKPADYSNPHLSNIPLCFGVLKITFVFNSKQCTISSRHLPSTQSTSPPMSNRLFPILDLTTQHHCTFVLTSPDQPVLFTREAREEGAEPFRDMLTGKGEVEKDS